MQAPPRPKSTSGGATRLEKREMLAFWTQQRHRIYTLFHEEDKSSAGIHQMIMEESGIYISERQWKNQIRDTWGWRKYADEGDWTIVWYLIHTAERHGIPRRIKLHLKEVTRSDLEDYIRRDKPNRERLLSSVQPYYTIPWYITYEDSPLVSDEVWKERIRPLLSPDLPSAVAHRHMLNERRVVDIPGSTLRYDSGNMSITTINTPENTHYNDPRVESEFGSSYLSNQTDSRLGLSLHRTNAETSGSAANIADGERAMARNVMKVIMPYSLARASSSRVDHLKSLYHAISWVGAFEKLPLPSAFQNALHTMQEIDPDMFFSPKELEELMDSDKRISLFLCYCLIGHIQFGQGAARDAQSSLKKAAECFEEILKFYPDESLSVLNTLFSLFEPYGQMYTVREFLSSFLQGMDDLTSVEAYFDDEFVYFRETVLFKLKSLRSEPARVNYDLDKLQKIYNSYRKHHGDESKRTLAAQFNLSWAKLQMGDSLGASVHLITSRKKCEKKFGRDHVQTIAWVATLARAQLQCDRLIDAEGLIVHDLMDPVEQIFRSSDPFALDKQYFKAIFLLEIGPSPLHEDEHQDKRRDYVSWAESILQNVLSKQVSNLGRGNRRTLDTFKALKESLESRNKHHKAEQIYQRCIKSCAGEI